MFDPIANDAFRFAVGIDICRVDGVDPHIPGTLKNFKRVLFF